jgi:hypothetical protein
MILGGNDRVVGGSHASLDDLFRRAGVRGPQAPALADPPNRAAFTGGAPRRLTYAQADRAISAFAARLRRLGLATDTVVALQLANTVESVIALLGVLRAGMIAAPLPLLWRQQEVVEALRLIGAKAIVTQARVGADAHAGFAMQAAADLFPVRYVCAFGSDLPDGVVALDDVFGQSQPDAMQPYVRPGNPAAHVAVVTFDMGGDGPVPAARNHLELIAGGLPVFLESGMAQDAPMLSAIPCSSFAGIALTVMPWLMSGGALHLHQAFDADSFAGQARALAGGTIVVPGQALAPLAEAGQLDSAKSIVALWRAPERLASSAPWRGNAALVDVAAFGEIGLLAARRAPDGSVAPIPFGAPRDASSAVAAIATARTGAGTLALRGPMVPAFGFPPGAGRSPAPQDDKAGFVDTGYACRQDHDSGTLILGGPRGGFTTIGGYRFRQAQVDAQVAAVDAAATIVALPDALLGQRLAGSAREHEVMQAALQARGVNPLIAGAFRPRRPSEAA